MSTDSSSALGSSRGTDNARVLPGAAEIPKVTLVSRTQVSLKVNPETQNRINHQLTATTADETIIISPFANLIVVAAQHYPWMHMASTLDACFKDAEETAKKDIKARSDALDTLEANISDERTRSEAERLIEFYGELSSDRFVKDAPKIMQSFLSHGDACTEIEAEALRIASQDLSNIDFDTMDIMVPLREYNDVLDRLGTLQMEVFALESAILRLTVSTTESSSEKSAFMSDESDDPPTTPQSSAEINDNAPNIPDSTAQSAAARSQIAPVFKACLPIIRARGQNITMAQQLVEGAKQNLSMTVHLQSLGLGSDDDHSDVEDED
ncbi:hypothetical protein GGU11DRAFT_862319 [Lentinula aff. detonsa]|nr:hypothetical protein GGU11DRAFT_862319 [Lentinula aff. detonsa]